MNRTPARLLMRMSIALGMYVACWLVAYVAVNQDLDLGIAARYFLEAWSFGGFCQANVRLVPQSWVVCCHRVDSKLCQADAGCEVTPGTQPFAPADALRARL